MRNAEIGSLTCKPGQEFGFAGFTLSCVPIELPPDIGPGRFCEHVYDRRLAAATDCVIAAVPGGVAVSNDLGGHWLRRQIPEFEGVTPENVFTCADGSHLVQGYRRDGGDLRLVRCNADWKILNENYVGRCPWIGSRSIDERNGVIILAEGPHDAASLPSDAASMQDHNSGLFRSDDNGRSWERIFRSGHSFSHFVAVAADPWAERTWWLTGVDRSGAGAILVSRDNGDTWTVAHAYKSAPAASTASRTGRYRDGVFDLAVLPQTLVWGSAEFSATTDEGAPARRPVRVAEKNLPLVTRDFGGTHGPIRAIIDIGPAFLVLCDGSSPEQPVSMHAYLLAKGAEPTLAFVGAMNGEPGVAFSQVTHASRAHRSGCFFSRLPAGSASGEASAILKWDAALSGPLPRTSGSARAQSAGAENIKAGRDLLARKAFDEALAKAHELQAAYPLDANAYELEIMILRDQRSLSEMEDRVQMALKWFPERAWLRTQALFAAARRGDVERCIDLGMRFQTEFPGEEGPTSFLFYTLRSAGKFEMAGNLVEDLLCRFPEAHWVQKLAALLRLDTGDVAGSLRISEPLAQSNPDDAQATDMVIRAYFQQGKFDIARPMLEKAVARFPKSTEIIRTKERLQHYDANLLEDAATGKRASEAGDALSALDYALFPDETWRVHFGGLDVVFRRLTDVQQRFPRAVFPYTVHVRELVKAGRREEAQHLTEVHAELVERDSYFAFEWANLAEPLSEQASARFRKIIALHPQSVEARVGLIENLYARIAAGDKSLRAEAEAACIDAIDNCPEEMAPYDILGLIAQEFGDMPAAFEAWRRGWKRFPNTGSYKYDFKRQMLDAGLALGKSDVALAELAAGVDDGGSAAVMTRVQNVGSTLYGCEYGAVQSNFGVEPLHLLRWVTCPVDLLVAALDEGFEAFDDASDLFIEVEPRDGIPEYNMRSVRYDLRLHTYIKQAEMTPERALLQVRRRCQFLSRRLREDLAAPPSREKPVYVYKRYRELVSDAEIARLIASLNKTGVNVLLAVEEADAANAAGTVRQAGPRHLVGYVENFGKTASEALRPIRYETWLQVCAEAVKMADLIYTNSQ